MTNNNNNNNKPSKTDLQDEARLSKDRVRTRLQAIIDEHLIIDPAMTDEALQSSLFEELPWKDCSPSGEFEAITS